MTSNHADSGNRDSGSGCARQFEPCVSGRTLGALANRRARVSPGIGVDQSQSFLGWGRSHFNGLEAQLEHRRRAAAGGAAEGFAVPSEGTYPRSQ